MARANTGRIIDRAGSRTVNDAMTRSLRHIVRYPVKGMSAEALDSVALSPGEGLPHDRRFALAHASANFDPLAPEWLAKTNFLMLMRDEKLAQLQTHFDPESGMLTVRRGGRVVSRGNITTPIGRTLIEQFFAAFLKGSLRGNPRLVEAPGHMFSDTREKFVSLINLASVRDLERVVGQAVDPLRFRGNLCFEGAEPWEEFDWVGRDVRIGDTLLRVEKRIGRCAATNVDPASGARDLNIPVALQKGYGHKDLGIYARVVKGGRIAVGEKVVPEP